MVYWNVSTAQDYAFHFELHSSYFTFLTFFISSHYMNFDEKCLYCLQLVILLAGQTYLLLERDQKTVLVRRTLAQGDRGLRPPYFYVRFTDHGIEKLNKLWVIYQVSILEQQ